MNTTELVAKLAEALPIGIAGSEVATVAAPAIERRSDSIDTTAAMM